jgi:bifunctional non-homologous end joining protein LigD
MGLETYWKKRDFGRTSEPRGKTRHPARQPDALSFVIQKHDARRLHYDFRLELDGVLKSWAVPKGPSLDPGEKRLAVETEDHPMEYGGFEGVIPDGEYGAGPVVVWDRGHWKPEGDPHKGYEKGHLTFELEGEKLRGGFHLVRTRGNGKAKSWLLMKRNDASALRGSGSKIVDERPESAISGRTVEEVEQAPDRLWHSGRAARTSSKKKKSVKKSKAEPSEQPEPSAVEGARKAALPSFIEPQLATLVDEAPEGDEWVHELKLDGYRMQMQLERGKVRAFTRRGHDWAARIPTLAAELGELPIERAVFDGELVVLRDGGISDFQRLQNSLAEGRDRDCVLFVFDLLYLNGYDLRGATLVDRKELLRKSLAACALGPSARIRFNDHVIGHGTEVFRRACELEVEGSVCKRASATYSSGRNKNWLKVKCRARQEFVIGGYTKPGGSRSHLGALVIGVMADGKLEYAGRVGTGYTEKSLRELHQKLKPLERDTPAFANPPRGADARDVHWVEPELVAEVEFAERTSDGLVRHASFLGLREDKPAGQVRDEQPVAAPNTKPAKRSSKAKAAAAAPAIAPELRAVRMTHPERVLFPEIGVTKAELALYYARVAERMLPHVAHRPLMLVRCPEGVGSQCFHQKHPTQGMSAQIKRVKIRESSGLFETMYVEDAAGLVQLVQNGALEIHSWGSRVDDVEHPDQITFDLDPDESLPWARVVEAAHEVRRRLEKHDLPTFLKTTGGKGLHIVVPLEPRLDWDEIKALCKGFAESMVRSAPTKYLATISKSKRKGKILIDYLRNGRGATAVCAYSTRAKALAPVAAPIAWEELSEKLRPDQFTLKDLPDRSGDPWGEFGDQRAVITPALVRALVR